MFQRTNLHEPDLWQIVYDLLIAHPSRSLGCEVRFDASVNQGVVAFYQGLLLFFSQVQVWPVRLCPKGNAELSPEVFNEALYEVAVHGTDTVDEIVMSVNDVTVGRYQGSVNVRIVEPHVGTRGLYIDSELARELNRNGLDCSRQDQNVAGGKVVTDVNLVRWLLLMKWNAVADVFLRFLSNHWPA